MNISPHEAEEALAAVQTISQKTRQSIASSGAHISLIITGTVWLKAAGVRLIGPNEKCPFCA